MDEGENSIKLHKLKNRTDNIAITLLHDQEFCEYKIYLQEVKFLVASPTKAMLYGIEAHARLNKTFLLATKPISIEEAIIQAKSGGKETTRTTVIVEGKILHGKIDEIHIGPKEIRIIDYKKELKAFQSSINQVWGYCVAFNEQFNPNLPMNGAIRNTDTQEIIWEKPFSDDNEKAINRIVERIRGIIKGYILPKATTNPYACMGCRYKNHCTVKPV